MIKSDKWIKSQCLPDTGSVRWNSFNNGVVAANIAPLYGANYEQHMEEIKQLIGEDQYLSHRFEYNSIGRLDPENLQPMITPFVPHQERTRTVPDRDRMSLGFSAMPTKEEKIVSFGLSSMGYDVRLDRKFKIFTNVKSALIDPLNMSDDCYVDHEGDFCIIPPNSYILGSTMETFDIPRDIMVVCLGKSTYARCGAIVNVTPIEPGFKGTVVIEISNATPLPLKVYAGQGIAQFLFYQSDEECAVSYADRDGKYQGQQGLVTARV